MASVRNSIRLFDHDRRLLVQLYLRWRIPIDQFEARPEDLEAFTREWRSLSHRKDTGGELVHYMRSQRKRGLWVRLGDSHEIAPPMPELAPEETETLIEIFYENVTLTESGSDVLAYDEETVNLISREFAAKTGRIVPSHQLVAKLTALRKRGLLPKVGNRGKDKEDRGFSDIDQAVG
jgi:hypothetical protein